ncbi:MAG: GrpB family protein [Flavobacteriales bacterium]|nr:GrpB family protein [Flavobacteriales bacterium]
MKIKVSDYNPNWAKSFLQIKSDLQDILSSLNPEIEHFGSTSVPGLAAKDVIDVMVGLESIDDLDKTILPMIQSNYIHYAIFDESTPDRRLFIGLKNKKHRPLFQSTYLQEEDVPHDLINQHRLSHVHIWKKGSEDWGRHLAFRDYLKAHPQEKETYGKLKKELSLRQWKDGMEYNQHKHNYIQKIEKKAIQWYQNQTG